MTQNSADKDDNSDHSNDGKPTTINDKPEESPIGLDRSFLNLLCSYPFTYLKSHEKIYRNLQPSITLFVSNNVNYVNGDNNAGIVGNEGKLRAGKVKVVINPEEATQTSESKDSEQKNLNTIDFSSLDDLFFDLDIDIQIHLLVTAIFSGNTLRFLNSCRNYIKQSHKNAIDSENKNFESPPAIRTSKILSTTGTIHTEADYFVESGKTQLKVIEFKDNKAQEQVLTFLRSSIDLDEQRTDIEALLILICLMERIDLREMGTPLIDLTRSQAAIGLGELAKSDYEYYLTNIIRPWATSRDPFLRFLVGWILFALCTEEIFIPRVISLLTHWSKSNNPYLMWTAAAACSRIGLIDLDQTMTIIRILIGSRFVYILRAVKVSLSLLYLSARNAYCIIDSFSKWTQIIDYSQKDSRVFENNVIPIFLSLIEGKLDDDINNKAENEFDQDAQITVFQLCSKLPDLESRALITSISSLMKLGFRHQSAKVVDWTCEVIEKLIVEADKNKDESWEKALYEIISLLLYDRIAAKHISVILQHRTLRDNQIARRLEK